MAGVTDRPTPNILHELFIPFSLPSYSIELVQKLSFIDQIIVCEMFGNGVLGHSHSTNCVTMHCIFIDVHPCLFVRIF